MHDGLDEENVDYIFTKIKDYFRSNVKQYSSWEITDILDMIRGDIYEELLS